MSLFSLMNDDPYGHYRHMNGMMSQMDQMMNNMLGYSNSMMPMAFGPSAMMSQSLMPFGMGMGFGMGGGRSPFGSPFDMLSQMQANPNCHSYSQSSVVSYSTDETGRPQIYKSSSSQKCGPGGVKETRKSVEDSVSGEQSMAIGHHIGERAHIIERSKNRYTGQNDETQDFINLEEEEAPQFNDEWLTKTNGGFRNQNASRTQRPTLDYYDSARSQPLAIEAGPSESRSSSPSDREVRSNRLNVRNKLKHKRKGGGRQ